MKATHGHHYRCMEAWSVEVPWRRDGVTHLRQPHACGLVASADAIAVAAGPLIGGLFTTCLSWRWVFAGEVLVVLIILGLSRRMAGHPGWGRRGPAWWAPCCPRLARG